jgi:transcriptional regulator GlxA family with amidase domain
MNFGFLVFADVEELDFLGPWEMLGMWRRATKSAPVGILVAQSATPVRCSKGLSINPAASFLECPQLDFLLVPGGFGTRREVDNPELIDFVKEQAVRCRAVMSVCTGAFVLYRAGLLAGKRATTHWESLERLRALGDVDVVEERFVRDGSIWTAAGVSAGIDLMLAFIASEAGEEMAGMVQASSEYFPSATRYGAFDKTAQAPRYIKQRP